MSYTNVKDVSFDYPGSSTIRLRFNASYYRDSPRDYVMHLAYTDAFKCCGMKTLAGFDVFASSKELQSMFVAQKMQTLFRSTISGGNLSFILNERQKKQCKTLLSNMKKLGGLRSLKVHNHTYGHGTITLFVWTLKGKK